MDTALALGVSGLALYFLWRPTRSAAQRRLEQKEYEATHYGDRELKPNEVFDPETHTYHDVSNYGPINNYVPRPMHADGTKVQPHDPNFQFGDWRPGESGNLGGRGGATAVS